MGPEQPGCREEEEAGVCGKAGVPISLGPIHPRSHKAPEHPVVLSNLSKFEYLSCIPPRVPHSSTLTYLAWEQQNPNPRVKGMFQLARQWF